jgi:acyl-CoA reductase-like NAD-dependent aldehyde dehydrogenase
MTSLTYRLYIEGTWQDSEGDAVLTVLNPATEEVIGAVPDATAGDVNRAVAAARRAFDEGPWPSFSPRERAAVMLRMADAYEIAKRIRAGMVYVNGGGAGSSPHTAFGGYKQSGLGLERGEYGLDEFLLSKSIIWSAR